MDVTRNPVTRAVAFPYESTVVPGANETVLVFDSTRMKTPSAMPTAAVAAGSAYLVPGADRGQYAGMEVTLLVAPAGQNVTLKLMSRAGASGTSADWQPDDGGEITVLAGTKQPVRWVPGGLDWAVMVVAGATPPSGLFVNAAYQAVL
jgi:hypothetical protein